jgi:hypothetical protein
MLASPPPASALVAPTRPAPAAVSGCHAAPATIYGEEPVVFEIEGVRASAPVDVELVDQEGRALAKARLQVPGAWRPAGVPSGDFRLQLGSNGVGCAITVNRELSRGRAAPQK